MRGRFTDLVRSGGDFDALREFGEEFGGASPLDPGGGASDDETVGADGDEEVVDVVGFDVVSSHDPCAGAGCVREREGPSGGEPDIDLVGVARGAGDVDDVVSDGFAEVDLIDLFLDVDDVFGVDDGGEGFEDGLRGSDLEEVLLGFGAGVAQ